MAHAASTKARRMIKKRRRAARRQQRQREYERLKTLVPTIHKQPTVNNVTVIEEAIRYIDQLHQTLLRNVQERDCPRPTLQNVITVVHELFRQKQNDDDNENNNNVPVVPSSEGLSNQVRGCGVPELSSARRPDCRSEAEMPAARS